MSRSERRAMVTSSADGFRDYLGLSSNELRSAASLNSHWLRTLRPRNLKPAAATLAPPFCPPSICDIASKALVNQVTPYSPELVLHCLPFESRGDLILRYVGVSSFDQNPERQLEHVPVDRLFYQHGFRQEHAASETGKGAPLRARRRHSWWCIAWTGRRATGGRTSKSNRATSGPYRRSIDLSVRFFPFREVTPTGDSRVAGATVYGRVQARCMPRLSSCDLSIRWPLGPD